MELVAQQGLDNAQLLYPGKSLIALTDGAAHDPQLTRPTVARIFTTQAGVKLSIDPVPEVTKAFTLNVGENIWGVPGGAQICVFGGDAELMY